MSAVRPGDRAFRVAVALHPAGHDFSNNIPKSSFHVVAATTDSCADAPTAAGSEDAGDPVFESDSRGKGGAKGKGGKGNKAQHTPREKDRRSKGGPGTSKPSTTKKRGSGAGNWGTHADDLLAAEQGAADAMDELQEDGADDSFEEV